MRSYWGLALACAWLLPAAAAGAGGVDGVRSAEQETNGPKRKGPRKLAAAVGGPPFVKESYTRIAISVCIPVGGPGGPEGCWALQACAYSQLAQKVVITPAGLERSSATQRTAQWYDNDSDKQLTGRGGRLASQGAHQQGAEHASGGRHGGSLRRAERCLLICRNAKVNVFARSSARRKTRGRAQCPSQFQLTGVPARLQRRVPRA